MEECKKSRQQKRAWHCVAGATEIKMHDGSKKIRNMKSGDMVYHPSGQWCIVWEIVEEFQDEMTIQEIKTRNGCVLKATKEQPMITEKWNRNGS